jgi:hypothetical protein
MRDVYGRWQPTPKEPTPTPRTMARIAEARQRNAARLERPSLEVKRISEKVTHTDITSDMAETLLDTFGTTSSDFVHAELSRLPSEQTEINAALAAIDGTRPENKTAAMLASQMVVTHRLAMDMMGRTKRAEFIDHLHAYGALATKLLRTFTMQTEALAKLKRGGEQTVRVEHVHVYPGGQAIVGAVSTQRAEGGVADERGNQADGAIDARAIAFAPGAAMFGADAGRDALPEGRGDGQEALPDARRGKRQRRAPL